MSNLEYILSGITILLGIGLILSGRKISALTKKLQEEHKKRVFPLLELRLDENAYTFFLENMSDTSAYAIEFDQAPVTLESGIERTFDFQFNPVDELKPHTEVPLKYELYHNNEKEPEHFKRSLFTHVSFSKIRFRLTYRNLHQTRFKMIVQKTRTHFQLIEAGPVENKQN